MHELNRLFWSVLLDNTRCFYSRNSPANDTNCFCTRNSCIELGHILSSAKGIAVRFSIFIIEKLWFGPRRDDTIIKRPFARILGTQHMIFMNMVNVLMDEIITIVGFQRKLERRKTCLITQAFMYARDIGKRITFVKNLYISVFSQTFT